MNSIKTVSFGNFPVSFQDNGYLNATVVATNFGKRVGDYLRNDRTQEYIAALAEKLSVTPKRVTEENQSVSKQQKRELQHKNAETRNRVTAENQLVIIKKGGNNKTLQGTWLHPKLAVDFARWLDPKFAVWCDEQIEQILSGSPKLETQTTIDERRGLVDAVKLLVARCGIDYSAAFRMVHQRFGVAHIDQIAAPLLPAAVAYVHSLTLQSGLNGEVLDRLPENMQPKPNGITFSEQQVSRFGTAVYFLDWATRQLAELSIPLKMLGAREKGVAAHTLWSESQSWLKHCRAALQEAQAQMHDPYYRDHLAGSLQKMADLSA